MADPKPLESLEQFFFETPLYAQVRLPHDLKLAASLYDQNGGNNKVDGFCHHCGKTSTFSISQSMSAGEFDDILNRSGVAAGYLTCVRNSKHTMSFTWRFIKMVLEKTGQYPSLATISNAELSHLRKLMTKADANEFYKATGLAAHGIGIGSFVYLRRVFERLIQGRFDEFKAEEQWDEEEFKKIRMREKIVHLKGHLPAFLVENAKIYSILSIGVHALDEDACLNYFGLMRDSIVMILEDDARKKEELEKRAKFSLAIHNINLDEVAED